MIQNLDEYENGATIETDLAVVGAGAAGITIARELVGTSRDVLLVESGGLDFEPDTQALYRGENTGVEYYDLDIARLRFFGGSTNHWGGHCRPLDPIDFERRDWVPHSGWPISRTDLDPYYVRAQALCELGPYRYEVAEWPDLAAGLIAFDDRKIVNRLWQLGPPTRFGQVYREALRKALNVDILTFANLVDIRLDDAGNRIVEATLKTIGGKAVTLRPRDLVIACGGIENARILLSCDSQHRNGIGNGHDLVGRFFMEHPHALTAFAVRDGGELERLAPYYESVRKDGVDIRARPGVAEDQQRRLGILNCGLDLGEGYLALRDVGKAVAAGRMPEGLGSAALSVIRDLGGVTGGLYRRLQGEEVLWFASKFEQEPNPESRVTLARDRDALGMRVPRLDWRLTDLDRRSVRAACRLVGEELGRLEMGRMRIDAWLLDDDAEWENVTGRYHHIGTTRMSENPREGVVDRNCRVHGIANLYIAGSSVFPTSGYANPTLTIVALAVRLSRHLKENAPA